MLLPPFLTVSFADKESEAQRGGVICPKSPSSRVWAGIQVCCQLRLALFFCSLLNSADFDFSP